MQIWIKPWLRWGKLWNLLSHFTEWNSSIVQALRGKMHHPKILYKNKRYVYIYIYTHSNAICSLLYIFFTNFLVGHAHSMFDRGENESGKKPKSIPNWNISQLQSIISLSKCWWKKGMENLTHICTCFYESSVKGRRAALPGLWFVQVKRSSEIINQINIKVFFALRDFCSLTTGITVSSSSHKTLHYLCVCVCVLISVSLVCTLSSCISGLTCAIAINHFVLFYLSTVNTWLNTN